MPVPIVMPRLGDFMTEGVVAGWAKKPGEFVQQDEVSAEIESEKVTYDLEAIGEGIFHPVVAAGDTAPVDGTIAYLLAEGEDPPAKEEEKAKEKEVRQSQPPKAAGAPSKRTPGDVVPSTPGARRLAARLKVDISQVTPTGPRGRVVESDVNAYAENLKATESGPVLPPGIPQPGRVEPVAGMRKAIAENMRSSLSSTKEFFIPW